VFAHVSLPFLTVKRAMLLSRSRKWTADYLKTVMAIT